MCQKKIFLFSNFKRKYLTFHYAHKTLPPAPHTEDCSSEVPNNAIKRMKGPKRTKANVITALSAKRNKQYFFCGFATAALFLMRGLSIFLSLISLYPQIPYKCIGCFYFLSRQMSQWDGNAGDLL